MTDELLRDTSGVKIAELDTPTREYLADRLTEMARTCRLQSISEPLHTLVGVNVSLIKASCDSATGRIKDARKTRRRAPTNAP